MNLFYKTRYLLIFPLLYLFGQLLEGPPTRITLLSNTFMLTTALTLVYTVLYYRILNSKKYSLISKVFNCIFILFHLLLVLSYLNILARYQHVIDKNYLEASHFFLWVFAIHLIFWFISLFDKRVLKFTH